jgi:hypothetical protein
MAGKQTALERLDQIVAEHPHSPASTRVTVTVGDLRDWKARLDRLTAECETAAETGGA